MFDRGVKRWIFITTFVTILRILGYRKALPVHKSYCWAHSGDFRET